MTVYKPKSELDFNPSRNLGYSVFFHSSDDEVVCESCTKGTEFDDDTTFIEVPNPEDFSRTCDLCNELIGCDNPPYDHEEAVERLKKQFGWCNDSAESFSNLYFSGDQDEKK